MKQSDFNLWLAYHGAAFPSFAMFIDRVSIETLEQWRGITVGCTLDTMRQATDAMLSGRLTKPFRDEDHVRAIRDFASRLASAAMQERDNRQQSHRCPLCLDSAYVTVLSHKTVEAAQRGDYDAYAAWWQRGRIGRPSPRLRWYTCALWCGCPIGDRQRRMVEDAARSDVRQVGYANMPVYDPDRHVRVRDNEAGMIDEAKRIKPANFEPAFAAWNEG